MTLPTGAISLADLNVVMQTLAVADQNKPVKTLAAEDAKAMLPGITFPYSR